MNFWNSLEEGLHWRVLKGTEPSWITEVSSSQTDMSCTLAWFQKSSLHLQVINIILKQYHHFGSTKQLWGLVRGGGGGLWWGLFGEGGGERLWGISLGREGEWLGDFLGELGGELWWGIIWVRGRRTLGELFGGELWWGSVWESGRSDEIKRDREK